MDALTVGSRLESVADFERLPIGAVIGPPRTHEEYVKQADGWWSENESTLYLIDNFSMNGYNEVKSLPKGKASKVTWESLAQWQFKYRDNAFSSAESAGVGRDVVFGAMQDLGLTDDMFPLGRGVKVTSEYDKNRLPVGTQVVTGDPLRPERFGLFVKSRASTWVHLLGEQTGHNGLRVEVVTGDEAEWATAPGTEAEQRALANFKAKAWRVGWKGKLGHRGCETYEGYMRRIGLTEDVLRAATHGGITVGERISSLMAAQLPEGSLLRWHSQNDSVTFTWYIRTDAATNEARTRALFGHRRDGNTLRNSAHMMEVMWIANEDGMDLRVDNLADIIEYVPVGTRLRGGVDEFVVCNDHRIGSARSNGTIPRIGDWRVPDFDGGLTITGFPS
jgi:hypothetical protein